jgi:hypothetical protein
MEDVCSARSIEHVWALEKARKRLAVLAVADEAKTGIRSPAGKRERLRVLSHGT